MNDYPPTPRMTHHARERCQQMGISTKVAKAIVRESNVNYPGPNSHPGSYLAISDRHPEFAVAYILDPFDGAKVVCTVLYNGVAYTRPEEHDG